MSPAVLKDYLNRRFCSMSALLTGYVDAAIAAIPDGGDGGAQVDDTAPSMTKLALASATGITRGSVHLSDGVFPVIYAWKNPNTGDTAVASSTVIVDGDGNRWYVLSERQLNERQILTYSPFP